MCSFDDNKLKFHKNLSCLKPSRTLLKNDDTLLEFRRTWRFLSWAGGFELVFYVSFDDKLKSQVS